MKTEAKKRLPQLFQMATLTFASVILLACDGDVTGPERDQSDPPASEAAVGSVTGFVTSLGWPAAALCDHQVLHLHSRRFASDVARYRVPGARDRDDGSHRAALR